MLSPTPLQMAIPVPFKSSLPLEQWDKNLITNDPDHKWILNGIKYGFKIVNSTQTPAAVTMDNYKSAFENRDVVKKQIKEEIIEGRYLTCSKPATIASALEAIPKADGGIRLIHDCSQPCGNALNDYATNESKIKYQTNKDAVKLLKPEGYMAKVYI